MLVEDNDGAIWAAFSCGDLARIKDGSVRFFTKEDGLPAGGLTELAIDAQGHLWSTKPGWLGVFRDGRFCLRAETPAERLCASRTGGVWLCDGRQIYKYTEPGGFSEKRALPHEGGAVEPTVLCEDRAGRLWIGTRLTGLFCYDGTNISKVDIAQQTIICVKEDQEGNIWVGTRGGGLKQLKPRVAELLTTGTSAPFEGIQSICKDTEGQLWAVFWNSGMVARNVGYEWSLLLPREGWDIKDARCVAADPQGGVWIGTLSKGVYRWQDGAVTQHVCSTNGLPNNCVNALRPTESGELWIGTGEPETEKYALLCWKDGKLRNFALPAGSGWIKAIELDAAGDCWAATDRGVLVRVQGDVLVDETKRMLAEPHPIRALLATPDRSLWIGYVGMGLGRLKEGRFTNYRMEQGLHDDFISHILSDRRDRLWLAGNRGIFSVREKELDQLAAGQRTQVQSVAYKQKDGLTGVQASYDVWPGAFSDADGRLFFAMQSGLATVYAEEVSEIPGPPSVFIDRVLANGKAVAFYGVWKSLRSPNVATPFDLGQVGAQLHLPLGDRQVEFSFTALSFTMPESIRFKYQLQGLDKEWMEAGIRRSVLYSQLAPGHYRLQVIACNRDGVWNEQGATLAVTIPPFWWETAGFRVGGPLLAVGVLLGWIVIGLRRRQQRLLERLELQHATEQERARIARDMHDELGSYLTRIVMMSESEPGGPTHAAETGGAMAEINHTGREMTVKMSEIVWSLNPAHDSLESFAGYVAKRAHELLAAAKIHCRLDLPIDLPASPLSSPVRHEVLLAFKEALHNIVKHAQASSVLITLRLDGESFVLTVKDDGKGFVVHPDSSLKGHGLANMKHRLAEAGGCCEVQSQPGEGTSLRFVVPLG
jgi:signal transduction histidine kinase/streptogramin lyase